MHTTTRFASVALALSLFALPFGASAAGPYPSSNLGYDMSYSTTVYPATNFNFGIVGVTRGKAFVNNPRLASQYRWAKFGSAAAPTFYMNLNAPYGSTVAGNTNGPKICPAKTATSTPVSVLPIATSSPLTAGTSTVASISATSTEPTACEGYNYGYNAAKSAFAYTKSLDIASPLWWLDIEEANSWSEDVAVNDATIQGAIDYLNTQHIQVGIYSMTYMWNAIAGSTFVPTQTLDGKAVVIPNWLPIGIANQVGAGNACVTKTGFIPGSPLWLVQYVANSTAIDQNYAC